MPGTLPATGSQLSFGRVNQAYTNNTPGAAGNAPSGGQNIRLSAVLGANATYGISQAAGTQILFSATFGGRSYPFTY
jgi:hypothetical protein